MTSRAAKQRQQENYSRLRNLWASCLRMSKNSHSGFAATSTLAARAGELGSTECLKATGGDHRTLGHVGCAGNLVDGLGQSHFGASAPGAASSSQGTCGALGSASSVVHRVELSRILRGIAVAGTTIELVIPVESAVAVGSCDHLKALMRQRVGGTGAVE